MENAIPAFKRTLECSTDENTNFTVRFELVKYFRSVHDYAELMVHNQKIIEYVDALHPPDVQPPWAMVASAALSGMPISGGTAGAATHRRLLVPLVLAMLEIVEHVLRLHARGEAVTESDLVTAQRYAERVMMSGSKDDAGKAMELSKQVQAALGITLR